MRKSSIFNFQFSIAKLQKHFRLAYFQGYTLIELLVVMAILITVGGIILSVLFLSLRGSNKSEVVTTVKQNGNFALNQIVKQIRFARALDNPASCIPTTTTSSITITSNIDGGQITFSCPSGANTAITSNSASLINTNAVVVTNCSFVCTQESTSASPRVTIQFTLSSRGANALLETQSAIPFQSSVILRNISQ